MRPVSSNVSVISRHFHYSITPKFHYSSWASAKSYGRVTIALALVLLLAITAGAQQPAAEQASQTDSVQQEAAVKLPAQERLPEYLQDISVTIRSRYNEGSGVSFNRDGTTFIWTAAHVLRDLRRTREVVDPRTGTKRTVVEFDDAKIIKQLVEDGRTVGRLEIDAEVIRYSDARHGEDLALLRVRKKDFIEDSAVFFTEKSKIPAIGTQLFHVGSLLGQQGSNSMTDGIMSQHGRVIGKKAYDQTTVTAFPGSSGGGVYLTDGQYVGMVVRGAGEGFNLMAPIRRIAAWAQRAGVGWAIDPNVPMPSAEDLDNMPIEDVGTTFQSKQSPTKNVKPRIDREFPFLIYNYNEEKKD